AMAIMEEKPVDALISDLNMPGMDGARLMDQVAEKFPQTVRCVFSGYPAKDGVLDLVKSTHQFLLKPDSLRQIRDVVGRAFALREILPNDRVAEVTARVKTLPSLPDLYLKLVDELQSEDPSVQRVGEIIEHDPSMTAKVLQLVNSAFFGLHERVNSAAQAANLLGMETIKSLVLMAHVFSQYDDVDIPGFSLRELWRHSAEVAVMSKELAEHEQYAPAEQDACFVGGLLHDVGKLVLAVNMPEEYALALARQKKEAMPLIVAEKDILGSTHAEVGAYLFCLWGFSDAIVQACAYHHYPSDCISCNTDLLLCVHVANFFDHEARGMNLGEKLDLTFLKTHGNEDKVAEWRKVAGVGV
ncbi:MAG: HDOD domain-containing protein, partial [Spartobacteria bacterium]|nr:HDOD domain-containing protein [Spartobacteria bacterium]